MAIPILTPTSTISRVALPSTGTITSVAAALPYGIYATNAYFLTAASDQVAYTYNSLGGNVLDIELQEQNVYSAYEMATLEYSYIVNLHQAKNSLGVYLGQTTGSFDQDGELVSGSVLSSSLSGSRTELIYPKFSFSYANKVSDYIGTQADVGGTTPVYSASFTKIEDRQDYDLQDIIYSASLSSSMPFYNKIDTQRIKIKRVYYKTAHAMWRFYGYYGGINTVGNLSSYGQYADDSSFELIPVWQNKLQAKNFESSIYTRNSHYSYEIHNNKLRIYPTPTSYSPDKYWVEFYVEDKPWDDNENSKSGTNGVNNINTIPFANIPYENINSMGKHWIRRFALALCMEILGNIRGKFQQLPIPGSQTTLNAQDLLSRSKEEQKSLREELQKILDEMTYDKVAEQQANISDNVVKIQRSIPLPLYVG